MTVGPADIGPGPPGLFPSVWGLIGNLMTIGGTHFSSGLPGDSRHIGSVPVLALGEMILLVAPLSGLGLSLCPVGHLPFASPKQRPVSAPFFFAFFCFQPLVPPGHG